MTTLTQLPSFQMRFGRPNPHGYSTAHCFHHGSNPGGLRRATAGGAHRHSTFHAFSPTNSPRNERANRRWDRHAAASIANRQPGTHRLYRIGSHFGTDTCPNPGGHGFSGAHYRAGPGPFPKP